MTETNTAWTELPELYSLGIGQKIWAMVPSARDGSIQASSQFTNIGLAQILLIRLGGQAFAYWDSLTTSEQSDYENIKENLKDVFRKRNFIATFSNIY